LARWISGICYGFQQRVEGLHALSPVSPCAAGSIRRIGLKAKRLPVRLAESTQAFSAATPRKTIQGGTHLWLSMRCLAPLTSQLRFQRVCSVRFGSFWTSAGFVSTSGL
jgi:hypothetical protein